MKYLINMFALMAKMFWVVVLLAGLSAQARDKKQDWKHFIAKNKECTKPNLECVDKFQAFIGDEDAKEKPTETHMLSSQAIWMYSKGGGTSRLFNHEYVECSVKAAQSNGFASINMCMEGMGWTVSPNPNAAYKDKQ